MSRRNSRGKSMNFGKVDVGIVARSKQKRCEQSGVKVGLGC
jgi:hypothetical protein